LASDITLRKVDNSHGKMQLRDHFAHGIAAFIAHFITLKDQMAQLAVGAREPVLKHNVRFHRQVWIFREIKLLQVLSEVRYQFSKCSISQVGVLQNEIVQVRVILQIVAEGFCESLTYVDGL
jgi:hypothetical protein